MSSDRELIQNPKSKIQNRPKRPYTVSEKVLAANRANLVKARAVPTEIRCRTTPARLAAWSRTRVKRWRRMPLERLAVHPNVRATAPLLGQDPASLDAHLRLWNRALKPQTGEERECVRQLGEATWQRLVLLRAHAAEKAIEFEACLRVAAGESGEAGEGSRAPITDPATRVGPPIAAILQEREEPPQGELALARLLRDLLADDMEFHQQLRQFQLRLAKLGNRWLFLRREITQLTERPRPRGPKRWRPNEWSSPLELCKEPHAAAPYAAALAAGFGPDWPWKTEEQLKVDLREALRASASHDDGGGPPQSITNPNGDPAAAPVAPNSPPPFDAEAEATPEATGWPATTAAHWARLLAPAFGFSEPEARKLGYRLARRLGVWECYARQEAAELRRTLAAAGGAEPGSGFGVRGSGLGRPDSGIGNPDSGIGNPESGMGSGPSGVASRESGIGTANPEPRAPDPETRPLLAALLLRSASEALATLETLERQADFEAALYAALHRRNPLPRCHPLRPDTCWTNRRRRRQMLEDLRWVHTTPDPAAQKRWRQGRGDGQRRHARRGMRWW